MRNYKYTGYLTRHHHHVSETKIKPDLTIMSAPNISFASVHLFSPSDRNLPRLFALPLTVCAVYSTVALQ